MTLADTLIVEVSCPPVNADPARVIEHWDMRTLIKVFLNQRRLRRREEAKALERIALLARLIGGGQSAQEAAQSLNDALDDLRTPEWYQRPTFDLSPEQKAVLGIRD